MKTTAKKTSTVHKSSVKPKQAKASLVKVSPKGSSKKSAKPAATVKTKAQVKSKPSAKGTKSAAKPAAKAVIHSKEKSKPLVKTAIKNAVKSGKVTATPAKPVAKTKTPAPVQKKVVTAKSSPKVEVKASVKSISKALPAKLPTKPQAPSPMSKAKSPLPSAQVTKLTAKTAAGPTGSPSKSTSVSATTPVAAVQPVKPKSSKAGFNSPSNIAPLNTSVSTAAKTSFTLSSPVLTPPPPLVVKKDAKLVNNWKTKTAAQLSDQEVIAMPDAEYMNDKQMAFFRLKLVELKRGILSNAGETTEHLREDTSVVPDPADRATIEEEHALELRTRDRERKLLKKIEQSIQRIDGNDYGYCDETGEAIGVARLIARPTATLSIEAQQRRELKQKMFGD